MSEVVIKVEDVSKLYRLGEVSTGTLAHDFNRWWQGVRGKEDPYTRIGEKNDRTTKATGDYVWALRDINFELRKGDVLGLIGKNGAGKSTLLKILSRTTTPTTGSLKVKGRLASLLEVGTGFHPELTGRDNIFLNGAILGMSKSEIKRKFDEIVDFSGVERYIDTPVKRYSSGMYVRLAFAVAAHLESEILIVDEVLAVGDAEFQKKCLGKMNDVSKGEGRTIIFVSHNMASIRQLCNTAKVMVNGSLGFAGTVEDATQYYLNSNTADELSSVYIKKNIQHTAIELLECRLTDEAGRDRSQFDAGDEVFIRMKLVKNEHVPRAMGYLVIKNQADEVFIETDTIDFDPNILEELPVGVHELVLCVPQRILANGTYFVYFNFTSTFAVNGFILDSPREILKFDVHDNSTVRGPHRKAITSCIIKWQKTIEC